MTTGGEDEANGPWLICLGREGQARDRFLRDHFQRFSGARTGVFLRSAAPMSELRAHLRGLMRVLRGEEEESRTFLRFWDPAVARLLLARAVVKPDMAARLCFMRSGLVLHWYAEDGAVQVARFSARGTGPVMQARGLLRLDAGDEAALAGLAYVALEDSIGAWLTDAYPDLDGQPAAMGAHVVAEGRRLGFTMKDEFSYLGHMMVFLGGWFHRSGAFPQIDAVLAGAGRARHNKMRAVFCTAWEQSHIPVVGDARAAILDDPALAEAMDADGEWPDQTAVSGVIQRHLPGPAHPSLRPLWQKAMAHARSCAMPDELRPMAGLLTLLSGYRFYEDPLAGFTPPATPDAWQHSLKQAWRNVRLKEERNADG